MKQITIHESGNGGDKLQIVSHGNGLAYTVHFGCAGYPMRTMFFQAGEDSTRLRDEFDCAESFWPERPTREIWFHVLDPYI